MRLLPELALPVLLVFSPIASADLEPNDSKAQAQPLVANGLASLGTTSVSDPDVYRVWMIPLGQEEVSVAVANTGFSDLTVELLGLQQVGGVVTTNESTLVSELVPPSQSRVVRYYSVQPVPSMGSQATQYVRIRGVTATATDYSITPSSTPIPVPQSVPGYFTPGSLTISTLGQTLVDTDFWVLDRDFRALPAAGSDDLALANPASRLVRSFTLGRYYLAISDRNLATNLPAPSGDGQPNADVTDHADVIVCTSSVASAVLNFSIDDGTGPVPVAVTKPGPHGVAFVSFQVGPPATGGSAGPFCFGDGLDPNVTTPCPCGNFGAPDRGCANSFDPSGAVLEVPGPFRASGMPNTVTHVYFQGDDLVDARFGDGVRCAGGNLRRLGIRSAVGGISTMDLATVQLRGQVGPGSGRRYYQVFYRNASAAFCPPETFNGTSGLIYDW